MRLRPSPRGPNRTLRMRSKRKRTAQWPSFRSVRGPPSKSGRTAAAARTSKTSHRHECVCVPKIEAAVGSIRPTKAEWPSPTCCTRLPWCTNACLVHTPAVVHKCLVGKHMPAWSLLCERPELLSLSLHMLYLGTVYTHANACGVMAVQPFGRRCYLSLSLCRFVLYVCVSCRCAAVQHCSFTASAASFMLHLSSSHVDDSNYVHVHRHRRHARHVEPE